MSVSLGDMVYEKVRQVMARREEILTAFIAKYGHQPDEMVMCEQPSTGKFWVEKRSKWVSVKDRLPKEYEDVLAYGEEGIVIAQYYGDDFGGWGTTMNKSTDNITHWMKLPEPPK